MALLQQLVVYSDKHLLMHLLEVVVAYSEVVLLPLLVAVEQVYLELQISHLVNLGRQRLHHQDLAVVLQKLKQINLEVSLELQQL